MASSRAGVGDRIVVFPFVLLVDVCRSKLRPRPGSTSGSCLIWERGVGLRVLLDARTSDLSSSRGLSTRP